MQTLTLKFPIYYYYVCAPYFNTDSFGDIYRLLEDCNELLINHKQYKQSL